MKICNLLNIIFITPIFLQKKKGVFLIIYLHIYRLNINFILNLYLKIIKLKLYIFLGYTSSKKK